MSKAGSPIGKIACVEWHDAEVKAIVLRANDPSEIEFAHLAVYHEVNAENFQIWSYRASLQLFGLRAFQLEGVSGDADYISDVVASGDGGGFASGMLPIGEQVTVETIEVVFGSGRKVNIECHHVQLVLHEPIKHVEDWDGPLLSGPYTDIPFVQQR